MGMSTFSRSATACTARAARVPLDHLADLPQRLFDALAGRERQAETPVARLVVGAGQHQVAEARQAHEGLGLRAERHAEPHDLATGRA